MGAFIEAAFVADDFAWVEGGSAPRGGLRGVAVEAASAQILGLLGGSVVGVLHGERGMGGRRVVVWVRGVVGWDDNGGGLLELNRLGIIRIRGTPEPVVVNSVRRRSGRCPVVCVHRVGFHE